MTVVLLHALPLDGSMWPADLLGPGEEAMAPTLYGLGDTIGAWASGVLDLAGSGPLTLVGCSVGGSCALEMARLAGDRVKRVVLIGAKPGHRPEPALRDAAMAMLLDEGIDAAWERYWAPLFAPTADPAVVRGARAIARAQGVGALLRGVQVFHGRPDRSDLVRHLGCPITIVHGAFDRPERGAALAAIVQDGTFHQIEDCGHYVPLEMPVQLAAVLQKPGPAG